MKQRKPADPVWQEFQAFAMEHGGEEFTKKLTQALGFAGLSQLFHRANQGCFQSAKWLAENWLGQPALTIGEQVATMSPGQVRETMFERYRIAWPWIPESEIVRMLDCIQSPAGSDDETDDR